MARKENY